MMSEAKKICTCQQTPADSEKRWIGDPGLCEMKAVTVHYAETRYGFDYGAAIVERCVEHKGYVVIEVRNRQRTAGVHVQVSPKGRVVKATPWKSER